QCYRRNGVSVTPIGMLGSQPCPWLLCWFQPWRSLSHRRSVLGIAHCFCLWLSTSISQLSSSTDPTSMKVVRRWRTADFARYGTCTEYLQERQKKRPIRRVACTQERSYEG